MSKTSTKRKYAKTFTQMSMARQSFKDECDPNRIVESFQRTGLMTHVRRKPGEFFAAPEMDFFSAQLVAAEAASAAELEAQDPTPVEPQEEPTEALKATPEEPELVADPAID